MAHLVLIRHGTSEYNKQGLWTGLTDVELAPEGREDARRAGESIRDIPIHKVHVSALKRTHQTLSEIREVLGLVVEHKMHPALNERDYGQYAGKNKWQVRDEVGEEEFHNIRRGWDAVVIGGENLKDVYARVVPYFEEHILPDLRAWHNVLVVAHGNSLRALVKHLEEIADEHIHKLEIGFGDVYCYEFDEEGKVKGKEIRPVGSHPK
ncbi:MAG: histidine phosphatase family protein [Patescibacteria group bacterium]|nr:histidine phosphatase family protein [bacterium]MDZ4227160.1 histidine phosphatase family protein [Patescibacteria group bacterium]